jgi:hypothetical protein
MSKDDFRPAAILVEALRTETAITLLELMYWRDEDDLVQIMRGLAGLSPAARQAVRAFIETATATGPAQIVFDSSGTLSLRQAAPTGASVTP